MTRDDGTQFLIRAADLRVLCRPTDSKPPVPGILVRTKRSALAADSDGRPSRPLLDIEANRADVRKGLTVTLPSTYAYHDPRGALLFIFDPDGATNGNELNSDGQDSSGSFFIRGRCGKHPKVTLKIEKAVIDSPRPTRINAEAVAYAGTIPASGAKKKQGRKQSAVKTEVSPVRPPILMPAMLSM